MGKKLYVGNLAYAVTDSDLQQMFAAHGTVQSAQIIMDRDTGRSKGFGFVEMSSPQEAQAAIDGLNGKEVGGRQLTVNEARPREDRGGGGRGGFGGGRGGSGRRYGAGGGGGGDDIDSTGLPTPGPPMDADPTLDETPRQEAVPGATTAKGSSLRQDTLARVLPWWPLIVLVLIIGAIFAAIMIQF